jgi:hypothetical protein
MILCVVSVPLVRSFEDKLRTNRSPAMVRKVLGSLSAILSAPAGRGEGTACRQAPAVEAPPGERGNLAKRRCH